MDSNYKLDNSWLAYKKKQLLQKREKKKKKEVRFNPRVLVRWGIQAPPG